MESFATLGLDALDFLILALIAVGSFIFTKIVFSKYIIFAKKKGWTGNDIHKHARPEVAESGGLAFLIGLIPAGIIVMILYPHIINETIVFLLTVFFSGIVGFIDDKMVLSPFKKIILTAITGGPIFVLNYFGFIHINSPIIPLIGQTQLNIIYPLAIPVIIAVMTNAVNMLEGYNGEGSGTSLISIIFLIICSIIAQSSQGLIFSLVIIGALAAFFTYNKYPAKVFPGDVGTLALGAAIACVGIFGSMEVAMFCTILVHVFNGFYVVASMRGFKERHTIKTKDIIVTDDDFIEASKGKNDHLTLPRLIVAERKMKEPELVHNFLALSLIGGLFSIVAQTLTKISFSSPTPPTDGDLIAVGIALIVAFVGYIPIIFKFKAIRGISLFMIVLLVVGALYLLIIDVYIVSSGYFNWLIAGVIGLLGFAIWYYSSIRYFWYKISKVDKKTQ
jgi:UDP-N-acetylglucosamine--dolichyl-phosphate N-acetylglucosaminephosphotransferase